MSLATPGLCPLHGAERPAGVPGAHPAAARGPGSGLGLGGAAPQGAGWGRGPLAHSCLRSHSRQPRGTAGRWINPERLGAERGQGRGPSLGAVLEHSLVPALPWPSALAVIHQVLGPESSWGRGWGANTQLCGQHFQWPRANHSPSGCLTPWPHPVNSA